MFLRKLNVLPACLHWAFAHIKKIFKTILLSPACSHWNFRFDYNLQILFWNMLRIRRICSLATLFFFTVFKIIVQNVGPFKSFMSPFYWNKNTQFIYHALLEQDILHGYCIQQGRLGNWKLCQKAKSVISADPLYSDSCFPNFKNQTYDNIISI